MGTAAFLALLVMILVYFPKVPVGTLDVIPIEVNSIMILTRIITIFFKLFLKTFKGGRNLAFKDCIFHFTDFGRAVFFNSLDYLLCDCSYLCYCTTRLISCQEYL